jgi:hypothetical protein
LTREKRNAQLKAHVPQSLREQYELFVREQGNVISLSDYLFGVLEEHAAMRLAKQKFGRRVANQ